MRRVRDQNGHFLEAEFTVVRIIIAAGPKIEAGQFGQGFDDLESVKRRMWYSKMFAGGLDVSRVPEMKSQKVLRK